MLDTLATFHLLMSSLNVDLAEKSETMLVTAAVFQYPIGPYAVAAVLGLVTHAVTAVAMLAFVMHVSMPAFPQAQVGYATCSVAPHIRYIVALVDVESALVESKLLLTSRTRNTFQLARFWLNANQASLNACERPHAEACNASAHLCMSMRMCAHTDASM
jgi:hypothetical protein